MWVIGDQEFVAQALKADKDKKLRLARFKREGKDIRAISGKVAAALHIDPQEIRCRARTGVAADARKIVAYCGHREFEIPAIDIARHLGVGPTAVSMMLAKGKQLAQQKGISLID
ncbi:MAG: hypothetical protein GF398_01480 [Chitinivibrionales bacterium]|nr:hypothetical protein [Chitinivibrionales bacterium]